MRILLALGRDVEAAAPAIAELAREHELAVVHEDREAAHSLELALRNALPGRDVISVLTQVVVAMDDPAEPQAIAQVRSLRVLLDAGTVVVCAADTTVPVALDGLGTMHEVEAPVARDLTAALLARRLDAELLLAPTGADVEALASNLATARPPA